MLDSTKPLPVDLWVLSGVCPDGGVRGHIMESLKSKDFVLWGAGMWSVEILQESPLSTEQNLVKKIMRWYLAVTGLRILPARDSFRGDTLTQLCWICQEVFHRETPLRIQRLRYFTSFSWFGKCGAFIFSGVACTFGQAAPPITLEFESQHAGADEGLVGRRAQLVTSCRTFCRTLWDLWNRHKIMREKHVKFTKIPQWWGRRIVLSWRQRRKLT